MVCGSHAVPDESLVVRAGLPRLRAALRIRLKRGRCAGTAHLVIAATVKSTHPLRQLRSSAA